MEQTEGQILKKAMGCLRTLTNTITKTSEWKRNETVITIPWIKMHLYLHVNCGLILYDALEMLYK